MQPTILQAIEAGEVEYQWARVTSGPVEIRVFADALKWNGVRVPVSEETTLEAALLLGAHQTTALIEDLVHRQADIKIPPLPFDPSRCNIAAWDTVVAHSKKIDDALAPGLKQHAEFAAAAKAALEQSLAQCLPDDDPRIEVKPPLVSTVGKSWVCTPKGGPVNYGWHGGRYHAVSHGLRVWQSPGRRHNSQHYDYSQTLRLVHQVCHVEGEPTTIHALLRHRRFHKYVAHDGPYPKD